MHGQVLRYVARVLILVLLSATATFIFERWSGIRDLLQDLSIAFLHDQLKLWLELGVEVVLEDNVSLLSREQWNHATASTYRILYSVCSVLGNLMADDLLGDAVRRGCFGHQLRVTGVVEAGEEEGRLINGLANSQETTFS